MGKSDFSSARHFGGNLDYGSFDRQLQRDKCRLCDLCVVLCTQLHDEFLTYLAAPARCMVLFSAKEVHVGWCHLRSPMHSPSRSLVPAPCSSSGSQWLFYSLWSFCKKPLCTHLLLTICSISIPRVWLRFVVLPLPAPGCQLALVFRTVRTCYDFLCNLLEILLINYGKPSSGGSIDHGAGPPGVHQIGGPNFGQVWTAWLGWVWGSWHPGIRCQNARAGCFVCPYEPTMPKARFIHSSSFA